MYCVFFDQRSPQRLDQSGFEYDSTFGYNETVGFRAGTLQAFKPLTARELLELPLHIMDTALFYPSHLDLDLAEATEMLQPMLDEAEQHGGALTVNWHDRRIAPERLWDEFYLDLLAELKRRHPWFPTAGQAVAWFRRRRSVTFDSVRVDDAGGVHVRVSSRPASELPRLIVRVHTRPGTFTDLPLTDQLTARVPPAAMSAWGV